MSDFHWILSYLKAGILKTFYSLRISAFLPSKSHPSHVQTHSCCGHRTRNFRCQGKRTITPYTHLWCWLSGVCSQWEAVLFTQILSIVISWYWRNKDFDRQISWMRKLIINLLINTSQWLLPVSWKDDCRCTVCTHTFPTGNYLPGMGRSRRGGPARSQLLKEGLLWATAALPWKMSEGERTLPTGPPGLFR